jgi:hypothetical protein
MSYNNQLVIEQTHADVIWRAAWLSLISMSHAMYHEQTCFAIVAGGVMFTSLNYWRNPVRNSWRRYTDIAYVHICLCYQLKEAYNLKDSYYRNIYYNCTIASALCYAMGYLLMMLNMPRASVHAHAGIHVVANIGNIALQKAELASISLSDGFANREPGDV